MPQLRSDVVEVFVVRWRNGRIEVLLGKRKSQQPIGSIWQPFGARIDLGEATVDAAKRAVIRGTGLQVSELFASDRTHQFFDHQRDAVVIAPVLMATVHAMAPKAGADFDTVEWFDVAGASSSLFIAGHRDALKRVVELIGPGGSEIELYRLI
jgi:ADP-ribose pyrophosphatase YjhB (NUDIX family)